MSAREEILARVRGALADVPRAGGGGHATGDDRDAVPSAHAGAATAGASAGAARTARDDPAAAAALTEAFAERAAEYRATVRRISPGELPAAIAQACAEHGARQLGVPGGLPADWEPAGVELVRDAGLSARELDALDGVLTGCALAIAETGTLVLDGGPRCGRRALTLVPDLHVCVVEAAQVVADLPAAFAALSPARPITLVSGPSATSDIELDRVEGVHGPRRLEILLVSRASARPAGAASAGS